jgi:DNA polymerase III subunit chi
MTEVHFHFNVPDRLLYACRLLRKALRSGAAGVAVSGPADTLGRLDRALWTFDAGDFIPHVLLRSGETLPPRLRRTPIWLVERAEMAAHHPVLVHLGEEPAAGFESFGRLIEIVSTGDEERAAARGRWKHYAGRGYEIQKYEVGVQG